MFCQAVDHPGRFVGCPSFADLDNGTPSMVRQSVLCFVYNRRREIEIPYRLLKHGEVKSDRYEYKLA